MFRPKPYISYSQMTMFEMSPEGYIEKYIHNKKQRISRNMSYGSKMATGLEKEEASGDPLLDVMMAIIPKFEIMDKPIQKPGGKKVVFERDGNLVEVPVLMDGDEEIPLLAIPDSMKKDLTGFKEYKTSVKPWTQKMADESGQITFYATAIWLTKGRSLIPEDIELVNVPVKYLAGGELTPTGDILRFKTKRTLTDILKMTKRIKKVWRDIEAACEGELL